ncbi:hypothetical protein B0H14DRAFT_2556897 [Mycena olivaceomarginata]|nr:hypothetical protein B0H14DRAFT_2556897 [Mycena olivaceomarginata]
MVPILADTKKKLKLRSNPWCGFILGGAQVKQGGAQVKQGTSAECNVRPPHWELPNWEAVENKISCSKKGRWFSVDPSGVICLGAHLLVWLTAAVKHIPLVRCPSSALQQSRSHLSNNADSYFPVVNSKSATGKSSLRICTWSTTTLSGRESGRDGLLSTTKTYIYTSLAGLIKTWMQEKDLETPKRTYEYIGGLGACPWVDVITVLVFFLAVAPPSASLRAGSSLLGRRRDALSPMRKLTGQDRWSPHVGHRLSLFLEMKYKLSIGAAQNTHLSEALAAGSEKNNFVFPKGPSGRVKLAPKVKSADASTKGSMKDQANEG